MSASKPSIWSFHGSSRTIHTCQVCQGTGREADSIFVTCKQCDGYGYLPYTDGTQSSTSPGGSAA